MQRPDSKKRQLIMDTAARLFAERPFHEVLLEDVAVAAHIGKGTVYLYFKGKDDLFASIAEEGLSRVVEELLPLANSKERPALARIEDVIRALATFARQHPYLFKLMNDDMKPVTVERIHHGRRELGQLVLKLLRQGIRKGELNDPNPELTAQFFPACVRAAIKWGPPNTGTDTIVRHVMRTLGTPLEVRA